MKIELPAINHRGVPLNDLSDPAIAWLESFEERAAIMQHDGNLSRLDAEARARELCDREFGRVGAA